MHACIKNWLGTCALKYALKKIVYYILFNVSKF